MGSVFLCPANLLARLGNYRQQKAVLFGNFAHRLVASAGATMAGGHLGAQQQGLVVGAQVT